MDIRRVINRNRKSILKGILIIGFGMFLIKSLNFYYEKDEEIKQKENFNNINIDKKQDVIEVTEKDYTTKSDTIEIAMSSFVNYCNKKELSKAYEMLTDECKNAMFPTIEDFETIYINNIYNTERTFNLLKWSTYENKKVYLVTLYGDLLSTGGTINSTQEYYTFIKDDNGIYKININNYIYGEKRNSKNTVSSITINIKNVDVYQEYEAVTITITNNTTKTICLTGNKYKNNIYLENSKKIKYSSLNSKFEQEEIVLEPNSSKTYGVKFNKQYSPTNKAKYLVLSDVILDYDSYLKTEDKSNYFDRTSIKVEY